MNALRTRMPQPRRLVELLRENNFASPLWEIKGAVVSNARGLATAKGKKAVPVKKKAGAKKKSSSGKGKKSSGPEEVAFNPSQRFDGVLESVLSAPSPVRHLTAKQKLRELELEKLGLVSKDKQRFLEAQKDYDKARAKAEKKGKGKKGKAEVAAEEQDEVHVPVKLDDAAASVEFSQEEGKRLAKEYSRYLMRAERARAAAETMRLQLKKAAIDALPLHLQAAAHLPDLTPFPLGRVPAALTPPVGGYVEELALAAQKAASVRKSR